MSIQRYIITYTLVAFMIVGMWFVMHKASQFDYRFVNKCVAAGGTTDNVGDMWQCKKDGKILLIDQ